LHDGALLFGISVVILYHAAPETKKAGATALATWEIYPAASSIFSIKIP